MPLYSVTLTITEVVWAEDDVAALMEASRAAREERDPFDSIVMRELAGYCDLTGGWKPTNVPHGLRGENYRTIAEILEENP